MKQWFNHLTDDKTVKVGLVAGQMSKDPDGTPATNNRELGYRCVREHCSFTGSMRRDTDNSDFLDAARGRQPRQPFQVAQGLGIEDRALAPARSLTAQNAASIMGCFSGRLVRQSERDSMLKKPELTEFRSALLTLQARIRGDVQQLTREALDRNEGGGESKSPTHIAELGTQTFEQDFSLRVAESDQDVLAEIDAALKRIDAGTFGACLACLEEGKTAAKALIPKLRLKAIPYAKNCVECERKRENLTP